MLRHDGQCKTHNDGQRQVTTDQVSLQEIHCQSIHIHFKIKSEIV